MKLNKFYLPVLSALLLASCSEGNGNEPGPDPEVLQEATITVAVTTGDDIQTRAADLDDGNNLEKTVDDYAVIYAIGDEVIGYGYKKRDDSDSTACVGLKAAGNGTRYKMLVIANAGTGLIKKDGKSVDFSKAPSFSWSYYQDLLVDLQEQATAPGKPFIMTSPVKTITVKPGFNYIGKGYFENDGRNGQPVQECTGEEFDKGISVQRIAARVELYTLSLKINDEDLKSVPGLYFVLDSIFMSNVRKNSHITSDGDVLENTGDYSGYLYGGGNNAFEGEGSDIAPSSQHVGFLGRALRFGNGSKFEIKESNNYTVNIHDRYKDGYESEDPGRQNGFYVMENHATATSGSYRTTLYLKGSFLDGSGKVVLPDRYFRIPLTNEVVRNHIYRIKATITGKGSHQPGENKENADIDVKITLDDWIVNDFEIDPVDPTPVK